MIPLPIWMRVALFATAVMNLAGAAVFVPAARGLREFGGLPDAGHPLYISTVGLFIFTFGSAYLYAAVTARADRLFIAVAAAGKLSFFALLVGLWVSGDLTGWIPLAGTGDLVFGTVFLIWLFRAGPAPR